MRTCLHGRPVTRRAGRYYHPGGRWCSAPPLPGLARVWWAGHWRDVLAAVIAAGIVAAVATAR